MTDTPFASASGGCALQTAVEPPLPASTTAVPASLLVDWPVTAKLSNCALIHCFAPSPAFPVEYVPSVTVANGVLSKSAVIAVPLKSSASVCQEFSGKLTVPVASDVLFIVASCANRVHEPPSVI